MGIAIKKNSIERAINTNKKYKALALLKNLNLILVPLHQI